MPAARGLFHRVATDERTADHRVRSRGRRRSVQRQYLAALKVDIERLRSIDTAALVAATRANDPSLAGRFAVLRSVLDQVTLPRHPFYPDAPPAGEYPR
jgi:para-nitrobenzyl esterase